MNLSGSWKVLAKGGQGVLYDLTAHVASLKWLAAELNASAVRDGLLHVHHGAVLPPSADNEKPSFSGDVKTLLLSHQHRRPTCAVPVGSAQQL
jgi:hypothetical protein